MIGYGRCCYKAKEYEINNKKLVGHSSKTQKNKKTFCGFEWLFHRFAIYTAVGQQQQQKKIEHTKFEFEKLNKKSFEFQTKI